MVRCVLISAVLAIAVAASCYQPTIADCVDTCGSSKLCPDGLSCENNFCRVPGGSGTCTIVDAMGSSGTCPMAPQGHGTPPCTTAMPVTPVLPGCLVACAPATAGSDAIGFHLNSWVPASIGSAGEETMAKALQGAQPIWIGLQAPLATGDLAASWTWANGSPMTYMDWAPGQPTDQGAGGNCGSLTGSGWISESCAGPQHPFMIASAPMP